MLCVHSAQHEWTLLQWICDVASLLESHPALDLAAILARARERGPGCMMLLGFGLAQRTFGTAFPPPVQQRLNSDAGAAALLEVLASRLFTPGLETSAVYEISRLRLAMRERFRDRAAYGTLRAGLEKKGRPIGLLDTLIGAHALALGAVLVTNNTREFARVPGLSVEDWVA